VVARAGLRDDYLVPPEELEPDAPEEPGVVEPEPDIEPEPVAEPEPDVAEPPAELGDDVLGEDGVDVVGGDADGVRSPGRSPTRPVPLSVHPAASAATSARAEMPVNALFMNAPPHMCSNPG
jgi:hypothetical protein